VRPGFLSEQKRRSRAEQLIGKPLKYITPDAVHSEARYAERGKQVIERAMDECYLVQEYYQYAYEDASPEEIAEALAKREGDDATDNAWAARMVGLRQAHPR
jgi:hypothetical protein